MTFPPSYWTAPGAYLYLGDVRECLRQLPARSVHCVVTSPPYWGLRDYGNDKSLEIGAEATPEEYITAMIEVFHEVNRVLRDDGMVWLNLGDKFDDGQLLIPARVALALRADGWKLVQDIIWYAPNKIPEPVTNRCTKSHEHIFLLAKSEGYYFDSEGIREPAAANNKPHKYKRSRPSDPYQSQERNRSDYGSWGREETANKRDVWVVPTQGYPGAHFAVYSSKLITPCIIAGTSEHGCCAVCSKPYERVVVKTRPAGQTRRQYEPPGQTPHSNSRDRSFNWSRNGIDGGLDGERATRETVGWQKMCGCLTDKVEPCVVLDPFVGSGTTVATAMQLGRVGVGIDLSEKYLLANAIPRIQAAMIGGKEVRATTSLKQGMPPVPKKLRGI